MASSSVNVVLLLTFFAFLTLSFADVSKRKVETVLYPDCASFTSCEKWLKPNATEKDASFPNVVYVRSSAKNDVLHFIMTTVKLPSILVVHTVGDDKEWLRVNWDHLLSNKTGDIKGAIYSNSSKGKTLYSFALTFSRLIEYDDIDDVANLEDAGKNEKMQWNMHHFSNFTWMNVTQGQAGKSIIFNTSHPQPAPYGNDTNGSMYFEFEINGDDGRDLDLPRLIYNANNTQMNFVLDKYVPSYNKSRFALEMTVAANYSREAMSMEEFRSIDDEFSPGVFRVVNWYSSGKDHNTGYLQWKPVCYLAEKRSRGVGTEVMKYDLQKPEKVPGLPHMLEGSVASAFFGDAKVVEMSSNVSFGLSKDGWYPKNNYTVWTMSVGYGKPPVEGISTLVIIIIAAGLGIPAIIIILGGIYVCARKRRSDYEEIGGVSTSNPRMN
ncbi:hypothetical protein ACOMHN_004922 [Nucella lapillus]